MHGLGMWSVAFHNGVEINSEEEFLSIFKNVEGVKGQKVVKFANG